MDDEDEADEDGEDDVEEFYEDDEDENEAPRKRGSSGSGFAADRGWFGEEVWGASARHRGAAADPAKLGRFALPPLATEGDLATWLGIPLSRLRWFTHDRPADTVWHYVRYTVPKRSGGERVILAPKPELKALQRKILRGLLAQVPAAPAVHGFVPGRSILSNAQAHVGRQVVLKLDLKDFFPSVTYPRVRGLFIALGYSFALASALALLCTEYERVPAVLDGAARFVSVGPRYLVQGAPTSPALANLVAWRLDRRLSGLAAKRGFAYTRYADDLTFSSDSPESANDLRKVVQRIVAEEQFAVNTAKTRLARRSARQTVTGLVVNDGISTPRQLRRRMRAILHNAQATGLAVQNREHRRSFRAYLQGVIAFVHAANPRHAVLLQRELRSVRDDAAESPRP
jgi:retron-type reverse transcriptase